MDVAAEMIADGAAVQVEAAARAGTHQDGDCLALVEFGHGGGDFSRAEAATERPLTLDVPKFAAPIGRRRAGG